LEVDLAAHERRPHPRGEAEEQPAEHEQDRVRDPERPCEDQQPCRHDEQRQELKLLLGAELEDRGDTLCVQPSEPKVPPVEAFSAAPTGE
jgi:hypothetical protein